MVNYYNEFDPKAAAGLKQLIVDGLIPKGDVDDRSITEVTASELSGYAQCHFFAGIGGWPLALPPAGWGDDRPVWTGSCPCQPFSSAGKQRGGEDHRHLWPVWEKLIAHCRPPTVFGEQVASAISHGWLDRVFIDLEGQGYSCGAAVLPACSVNAPHKRDRLWFVANAGGSGRQQVPRGSYGDEKENEGRAEKHYHQSPGHGQGDRNDMANPQVISERESSNKIDSESDSWKTRIKSGRGCLSGGNVVDSLNEGSQGLSGDESGGDKPRRINEGSHGPACETSFWDDHDWIICGDGKARRIPAIESGIRILAHGVPERVGLLRAGGNAIVPEVAARFIKAADQAIWGIG